MPGPPIPATPDTVFGSSAQSCALAGVPVFSGSQQPKGTESLRLDILIPKQPYPGVNATFSIGIPGKCHLIFIKNVGPGRIQMNFNGGPTIALDSGDVVSASGEAARTLMNTLAPGNPTNQVIASATQSVDDGRLQIFAIVNANDN